MKEYFRQNVEEIRDVQGKSFEAHKDTTLPKIADVMHACLAGGNKIMICGNGGSASDAMHIAAEFVVRLKENRRAYPAMALSNDPVIITACGNDLGYEMIFARQVEAFGKKGDVIIALSTSGNSPNVIKAIEEARKHGVAVIGVTGEGGGKMASMCDVLLDIKSKSSARIQETYMTFLHTLCFITEKRLAGEKI